MGRPLNVTGKKYKGNNNKCEAGKKRKNNNISFNEQKEEIIFYGELEGKFKPNNKLVRIVPNSLQSGLAQLGRMCSKETKEEPCTPLGKVIVNKSVPCINKVLQLPDRFEPVRSKAGK